MSDFTATISRTRVSPLSNTEHITAFNRKYTLKYTDLTAQTTATGTSDTVTITLGALPARWVVDKCCINVTTAFANGTGTLTLLVGTTTSVTAFFTATSVTTAGLFTPTGGVNSVSAIANSKGTATANMIARFTAGAVAPASATAGEVDVYLSVVDLDQLG